MPPGPKALGIDVKTLAAFWNVSPQTLRNWHHAGHRVDDVDWMIENGPTWSRAPASFLVRIDEIRLERARQPAAALDLDPAPPEDFAEIPAPEDHEVDDLESPREQEQRIDGRRRWAQAQLDAAVKTKRLSDIKLWSDQVLRYEETLRRIRESNARLGLDTGDLFKRSEVERWIEALAFWLVRAVDNSLETLCPRLTGLDFPEEVRRILEEYLLDKRFLSPLARSVNLQAGLELPPWFVERLRDTVDDFIENGVEEFEAARTNGET